MSACARVQFAVHSSILPASTFLIVHRGGASGHRGVLNLVISPPALHVNSAPAGPPGKFVCAIDKRESERESEWWRRGQGGEKTQRVMCRGGEGNLVGRGGGVISKIYGAALHKMHASCN